MSKKFVVGFLSFFDNDLKMEIVKAETAAEAMMQSSFLSACEFTEGTGVEDIQDIVFEMDAAIGVIEI